MNILVTGGAGYIGSFMVKRLLDDGHTVIIADSLERGHADFIDSRATLKKGDLRDKTYRATLFSGPTIDAIIHFAGYIAVGESMKNPYMYFNNNVSATIDFIEDAYTHNVKKIIFSSSAAVYGNPVQIPIPEDHQKLPTSVYGDSKLMIENILHWYSQTQGMNSISLRYFNACGAALDGSMGEGHTPETHIIPNAIQAAIDNKPFTLFGNDYKTSDGTCVRDYIHVLDLVDAHVRALQKLDQDQGAYVYNVGTGKGYSNKEIVEMVKKVSGKELAVEYAERRTGDSDTLIADASRIQSELQFKPLHSDLETIVRSAWTWHTRNST